MCHKTNIEYIEKNMIYMSTIGLKINYEMILNSLSKQAIQDNIKYYMDILKYIAKHGQKVNMLKYKRRVM